MTNAGNHSSTELTIPPEVGYMVPNIIREPQMYDLQKNVPIPKVISSGPRKRKYPFDTAEIGEMFFIPDKTKNTIGAHVSAVSKQLNREFVTRLCYMRKGKQGWEPCEPSDKGATMGVGVWRTK